MNLIFVTGDVHLRALTFHHGIAGEIPGHAAITLAITADGNNCSHSAAPGWLLQGVSGDHDNAALLI